jgi:DNA-binding IclR family transcriptional regulator
VLRALSVITPDTLGSVTRTVGLSKATTHRVLGALSHEGFVMQDQATGLYSLGPETLKLANLAAQSFGGLAMVARPAMRELWKTSGETVVIQIRLGAEVICIGELASTQAVHYVLSGEGVAPIYVGSAGKTLLAFTEHDVLDIILQEPLTLPASGEPVDIRALRKELKRIELQGWAASRGERTAGGSGISAPIFERSGSVIAALSIIGPTQRLEPRFKELQPTLVSAASWVTTAMSRL